MTTEYVSYVTEDGDRWDMIAYKFYGDVFAYEPIINANPTVAIRPVLDGGIRLRIPVRETTVSAATLPPWKRSTT